jgi:23S rRNA (guanosine2251-2'-O)-methyltransferase
LQNDRSQYVYGIHPVEEALESGQSVQRIFIDRTLGGKSQFSKILQLATAAEIPVQMVPAVKLDRLSNRTHQGVIMVRGLVDFYKTEDILPAIYEKGETPLLLILDRVTDVRNFGAVSRTAYAAGVHAIVIPFDDTAEINPDAIKASAGALNKIAICREKKLIDTLKMLRLNGIQLLAAEADSKEYIYQADLKIPLAIIMGSEGFGVKPELLKIADHIVKVPMERAFDSYNVSVACGMMLYEVMRQRKLI